MIHVMEGLSEKLEAKINWPSSLGLAWVFLVSFLIRVPLEFRSIHAIEVDCVREVPQGAVDYKDSVLTSTIRTDPCSGMRLIHG